ncbi:glutathione S-transferase [Litoribacillus peritrichatus]|uniref:Glutathione S-transferase n=1 Tax=Litoribacillus peritrichatus TaxID=718191 RepID=A0ABP7M6W3_9GAMM
MNSHTLKLYSFPLSGHSHRAQLFLSFLNIDAEIINVDLLNGEQKNEDFLKLNLLGQVPVLQNGDTVISDSNAILIYLAEKFDTKEEWYPKEPATRAEIQRFLSIAQNEVAHGPAAARLVTVFGRNIDHEQAISKAQALLEKLNKHFANSAYAVGNNATIADISLYTYIAHAPEGSVSLEPYPHVVEWLNRIESLPNFIPMKSSKAGLVA